MAAFQTEAASKLRLCEVNYLTVSVLPLLRNLPVVPISSPTSLATVGKSFGTVDITVDDVYTWLFDEKADWYHLAPSRHTWDPCATPCLRTLKHPGGSGGDAVKGANLAVERLAALATLCLSNGGYFSFLGFTGDYLWNHKPVLRLLSSPGVQQFLWSPCLTCISNAPWFAPKNSFTILSPRTWAPFLRTWLIQTLAQSGVDMNIMTDNDVEKPAEKHGHIVAVKTKWNKLVLPSAKRPAWNKLVLAAAKFTTKHKVSLQTRAPGLFRGSFGSVPLVPTAFSGSPPGTEGRGRLNSGSAAPASSTECESGRDHKLSLHARVLGLFRGSLGSVPLGPTAFSGSPPGAVGPTSPNSGSASAASRTRVSFAFPLVSGPSSPV